MASQAMLDRLIRVQASENQNLQEAAANFGEYSQHIEVEHPDSVNPVFEQFVNDGGSEAIKTLTNFTIDEFNVLWSMVEVPLVSAWTTGRGRKSKTNAKDSLLMALCVLKHYDTWAKHAMDFNMGTATFEKMIMKVVTVIEPVLKKLLIKPVSMTEQIQSNQRFTNYPYSLYATDVKFQPSNRPMGRFSEQTHYFSGKHKLYGVKIECSVAYPGVAVDLSEHHPGSVSDFTIFRNRIDIHKRMLRKTEGEQSNLDHGEGFADFPDYWAVLVDMGYQGASNIIRAIHPKRKPPGAVLDHADVARNSRVSSDRVLVENYFGRVCMLWKIGYVSFKWDLRNYDMFMGLIFALTNFHVSLMPLRAQDQDHYRSIMGRYHSMAKRRSEASRQRQQ